MRPWSWSAKSFRWHEWLICSLAFVAMFEGPYYFSEFVRGVAVGLCIGALVSMIVNRRALFVIVFAVAIHTTFRMAPRTPAGGWFVAAHVFVGFALLAILASVYRDVRGARRTAPPAVR